MRVEYVLATVDAYPSTRSLISAASPTVAQPPRRSAPAKRPARWLPAPTQEAVLPVTLSFVAPQLAVRVTAPAG